MFHTLLKRLSLTSLFRPVHPYRLKEPVVLCSYPKSGRTWLRFILANYINDYYGLHLNLNLQSVFHIIPNHGWEKGRGLGMYRYTNRLEIPFIVCSHVDFCADDFGAHRRVFLIRSVYDVLVSNYFHMSRQLHIYNDDLARFIRDEKGVTDYIDYLNSWAPHLSESQTCILTYERLSANTYTEVKKALDFGRIPIDPAMLEAAIERCSFDYMQKVELEKGIAGHSYDAADQEARRIRRGIVGGYADYLSPADQNYIRTTCYEHLSEDSLRVLRCYDLLP